MIETRPFIKALPSRGKLGMYSGAKVGMVFRLGHLVLGYYKDGYVPVVADATQPASRSKAVVQLELNELVPACLAQAEIPPVQTQQDSINTSCANATAAKPPENTGVRSGKRRGQRGIVSVLNGPWERGSLLWPHDQEVPINDLSHRDQGWWAVDAVNPNAWPAAREYMHRTSTDVVLVAETKVSASETALAEQIARGDKWNAALQPCIISTVGVSPREWLWVCGSTSGSPCRPPSRWPSITRCPAVLP